MSKRQRIRRSERIRWAELEPARQASTRRAMYEIFATYYEGFDETEFGDFFLSRRDVRVLLMYGEHDRIVGFCTATLTIIPASRHRYGVFSAGVYIGTRYKGGFTAARFGLREALRVQLRHPELRLGYLSLAHTPAPYRLLARTMPRLFPSRPERSGEPRGEYAEVMLQMLEIRGWPPASDDPWVVAAPFVPTDTDWVERTHSMRHDPDVRFFLQRVPGWSVGHALAVWIPLELRDIIGGLRRLRRRRRARRRRNFA